MKWVAFIFFLIGIFPADAAPPITQEPVASVKDNFLTLTYGRAKSATGFSFTFGISTNLSTWAYDPSNITQSMLADDGTNETWQVRDTTTTDLRPKSYMRLVVKKRIQGAKVVCFGDSITLGYGVPTNQNWCTQLASRFALNLVNSGVSGNTSSQGLARIQNDVLAHNPDFVIINFGMNDHVMTSTDVPKVSQTTFRSNLLSMITRVRTNGAIPVLVTVNSFIEGNGSQYYYNRHPASYYTNVGGARVWLDSYIQIIREISQAQNVDLVDVRKAFDNYDPYQFLRSLSNAAKTDDGVHPYLLGSTVYANTIGDYLQAHYQ